MKKVFVVVLNWNGGKMTFNCLDSLLRARIKGFQAGIIVVDNGSTDGSPERVRELGRELGVGSRESGKNNQVPKERKEKTRPTSHSPLFTLKLIENKINLGFAAGNNVGLNYALKNGADYVCLLNNDTRVDPNFLTELVKAAEDDPKIGIMGGKIYFEKGCEFHKDSYQQNERGKVIWYAGGIIDWDNVYASHRGVNEVDCGQYDRTEETPYVSGCLMLVKADVLRRIGFLDERYFAYFEENDFCQRAKWLGYRLVYNPKTIIWHLNAGSSGAGSELHDYYLTRNRLLFGFRWAPLKTKLALIKESFKLWREGRKWQRIGVRDFYLGKLGKGSWEE